MVNEGIINLGNAKLISLDPNISISCSNDIKFLTSDTEKMRIDSSGNVGIGITNPSEKLVLSKNIGLGPNFQLQNIDNMERVGFDSFSGVSPSVNPNTSSYLNFSSWPDNWFPRQFLYINRDIDKQYTSSGPDLQNDLAIEFGYSNYFYRSGETNPPSAYYPAGSAIRFHTANNNSTLTEKMCIDYQGNIGIGTTNPTSKLHVNGDTNIVGNLKINDSNISLNNLDDVTVSETPVHNDVLSYQSGQWTNRTMHNRNYQYASSTLHSDTSIPTNQTWIDVNGMATVSIIPTSSSSSMRISVDMYFEVSSNGHELLFRLVRQVNGQPDVYLNTTNPTGGQAYTLGVPFQSRESNNETTVDGIKFKFIETPGTMNQITYKVQCRFPFTTASSSILHLNSTVLGGTSVNREYMTSWIEVEEISNGPPLTTNNVAVSGTPVHNDVLTYQSGQWTNTSMHTRNYQYKQINDFVTTNYNNSFTDIAGFTGSNLLQITTLRANSKVRVHFIIRGESNNVNVHDLQFNLVRRVNGANPTDLNANLESSYPNQTATLANVEISAHQDAYHTMDTVNIYYIDSLDNVPAGSVVSYTPQLKDFYATSGNTFRLNSVDNFNNNSGQFERTISISEAEEMLTGPPLTTNNVAVPTTNLNNNDVLSYQSGQWTNTAMHTRNYQYKQQTSTSHSTSLAVGSFNDLQGFTGTDALQITTLQADSTVRIHFIFRGEPNFDNNYRIMVRLQRTINSGSPTYLNAPDTNSFKESLAVAEQGYYIAGDDDTADTYEVYYVDTLPSGTSAGSVVKYVPQLATSDNSTGTFYLNRTRLSGGVNHEAYISIGEAEEILTGPPLQINSNVVTATPNVGDFLTWSGSAWVASYPTIKSARFTWGHTAYLYHSNGTLYTLQFRIQDYSGGDIQLASNYTDITMQPGRYLIYFDYPYRRPNGYADRVIFIFKKNGGYTNKIIKAERYCNAASHNLGNVHNAPYDNVIISGIIEVSSTSDIYTATIQGWTSGGVGHLIPNTADTMNAGYIIRLF